MRIAVLLILLATSSTLAHADWRKDLKDAAKQKAGAQVDQKLGIAYPAPAGSAAYLINLKDGTTVASPLLVQFGLKNAGICPAGLQTEGTGHHILLIDDPQIDATVPLPVSDKIKHFDKGQTETSLTLPAGKHSLQLLFVDWKQQSFNPAVMSEKITVTVSGAAATAK